jgi:DNA-directed RNA polymerase specialized sigma24 family protein
VITPPFETVWPDVERRLKGLLYRRGLDAASTDDVVQEVALRALAGRVTFTSARDLLRWAGPVACNLHVDLLRQRARLHDEEPDLDHPAAHDVAGEVADRMELQRTFRGMARLRPADQQALLEAMAAEPPRPTSRQEVVRLAVRRHRARSRLAVVLEQLAVWPLGWRWSRRTSLAAVAAVPMALPLVLGLRPPDAGGPAVAAPEPAVGAVTKTAYVVARVAPRRAAAPAPAARAAEPRRTAPAERARRVRVARVDAPHGVVVEVEGRDREPGERILCVRDVPYVPEVCL